MNSIRKVRANFGDRSFDFFYGIDAYTVLDEQLETLTLSHNVVIVSHPEIKKIWGERIEEELKKSNRTINWILLPPGEQIKNLETVSSLYMLFNEYKVDKSSAVIALGGGVLQDLTDFSTATYMRGVPFIQIPTTLLSQADIGIGGCAVDHPKGKSLIGTFYPPKLAILDASFLTTLSKEELQNGLAEVINKVICLGGKHLETFLDDIPKMLDKDLDLLSKYISESNAIKLSIIESDEIGIHSKRFAVDFGHTLTYALERATNFTIPHGIVLGVGMRAALLLSEELCGFSHEESLHIQKIIEETGLLTHIPNNIDSQTLVTLMHVDQKVRHGKVRFVLLKKIGEPVILQEVEDEKLLSLIKSLYRA
jgi:3-dehydroquinate synthase